VKLGTVTFLIDGEPVDVRELQLSPRSEILDLDHSARLARCEELLVQLNARVGELVELLKEKP
jgi:hypothetical protein